MFSGIKNITKIPELQKRILFTLALLAVYRVGAHVPTPGIDTIALAAFFEQARGSLLGLFDMFAGGALRTLSVFALGIMPYISASIILQLLTVAVPHLEKLKKEGEAGRRKITQYTRYGTVILSIIQGFGISVGLESMAGPTGLSVVLEPGWSFRIMGVITLTAGTSFLMWLGETITEKGIGNGISLLIFAGIIVTLPAAVVNTTRLLWTGELGIFFVIALFVFMLAVVGFIVFVESGQRRIPVQYAKRVIGRKMYGGQTTHLPLKVNTAGVIPAIFASSIIMFPATIANFVPHPWMNMVASYLMPGRMVFESLYVAFIIFFCYFYTAVTFNPVDVADNMKKHGGYIPGIRPGKKTAEHLDWILTRITFSGALYVSAVCVLPSILISQFHVPFYFGGTALLIVVGVALDTAGQIETHLLTRQYEGFMKKGKLARRR
ncbi:MAG: preprotein translocase subunit SecY [Syntrophales bacterium]|nr:preprotein translocase subunit SecY [Syntrophales bacterium]MCK9527882.1 preprotein translocase subunit SecY [Syntrophales bacterium]MDX9921944.1 preprotein translocase subunit SecY [Syntrophales bacterium]